MINKVTLIGNIGKDPEFKTFENGNGCTKFSLATNESWKDDSGEWQKRTEWHNVVIWGKYAERIANSLKKGNMVYVEGKVTYRSWQDVDGNTKYITEIQANVAKKFKVEQIAVVEPSSSTNTSNEQQVSKEPKLVGTADQEDDLPF